jgi:hypothetical protein
VAQAERRKRIMKDVEPLCSALEILRSFIKTSDEKSSDFCTECTVCNSMFSDSTHSFKKIFFLALTRIHDI